MHLAEEDEFISTAVQAQINAALASKPNAVVYSYPSQRDTFACHSSAHHEANAARWRMPHHRVFEPRTTMTSACMAQLSAKTQHSQVEGLTRENWCTVGAQ